MNEAFIQKTLVLLSFIGAVLLDMDLSDPIHWVAKYISIVSFIVILVSNWSRVVAQLKKCRPKKKRKKKQEVK